MVFEIENYETLKNAVDELCEYLALHTVAEERIFDSKLVVYELLGNVLQMVNLALGKSKMVQW